MMTNEQYEWAKTEYEKRTGRRFSLLRLYEMNMFLEKLIKEKTDVLPDKIIRVSEKSFRCDCGCNVFKEYETLKYSCNSCNATYTGEKEERGTNANRCNQCDESKDEQDLRDGLCAWCIRTNEHQNDVDRFKLLTIEEKLLVIYKLLREERT